MAYDIGTPGQPWGDAELKAWQARASYQRSYQSLVVDHIFQLSERYQVDNYGALAHDPIRYALFALKTSKPDSTLPWVLITGGVHGYETSGVLGALSFLQDQAIKYQGRFNFVVLPCVSPWGFETINRWNFESIDPNRSFKEGGLCDEARLVMQYLDGLGIEFVMHIDLHETTDTDATEFRPALAAKLGKEDSPTHIPDGFYLVGDKANPQDDFQAAIIEGVEPVTHIAPNDKNGCLLGDQAAQRGVVNYDVKPMGLCAGVTNAQFTTTTEVYPDSPRVTPQQCIDAQIAAISAGLDVISNS